MEHAVTGYRGDRWNRVQDCNNCIYVEMLHMYDNMSLNLSNSHME